ncbi:hypothetical protein [Hyalangium minutum]|uniref:Uncharacterized protein n=1 Tax=Hyalangium minutum TaxID=394096 RepID=A0A085WAK2_9BACT|nr:hypothetical protein [Hyalangium minutum]KFE64715.1 hypothetical protein DB31_1733 [Hyalangium minutum]
MTTIAANAPRIQRSNSAPVAAPAAKPELSRTNSAPGKLQTPAATAAQAPAAQAKPAAASGIGAKIGDSFSKAGGSVKGWYNDSSNRLTTSHQNGGTGVVGRGLAGAGLAGGLAGIGSNGKGLVDAIKNGEGGHAIAENALGLGRSILGAAKGGLDTAAAFTSAKDFGKLAEAAKGAVAGKGGAFAGAIANAAAEAAHKGGPLRHADAMASVLKEKGGVGGLMAGGKMAVADLLRQGGFAGAAGKIEKGVIQSGTKVVGNAIDAAQLTKGAGAALKGIEAGAKGVGTAAKVAGRFAPGLNIGIAALDAGIAARTWADPKSSTAAKVTSTITAAGSAAAATNIPIVSQIGAGISAVSSITGMAIENAGKIKEGFSKLGDKIKSLF